MTSQSVRRPAPAPSAAPIPRPAVLDVAAILPDWLETLRFSQRQTGLQLALWHEGELVADVADRKSVV